MIPFFSRFSIFFLLFYKTDLQSFLGAALYFKYFVPNYSNIACELNKMTHKDFNWKRGTWTYDYEADFNIMKTAL